MCKRPCVQRKFLSGAEKNLTKRMTGLWLICFLAEFVMTSTNTHSTVPCYRPQDIENIKVIQGEGLYWPCPNLECSMETNDSLISWFKNTSDGIQQITSEKSARVHHHGPVLYILPLTLNDTGYYITRWWWVLQNETGCNEFGTNIVVYKEFHTDQLYSNKSEQPSNVLISCPVRENQKNTVTWYKDFHLIPGESEKVLRVADFSKKDEGIYTCLCTWEHHGRKYNSSGSHQLRIKAPVSSFHATIVSPTNNSVKSVDLGSEVELTCSAFFGINMMDQCSVSWFRSNTNLDGEAGYTITSRENTGELSSSLIIAKVSEVDLQSEFYCKAKSPTKWVYVIITLKPRESVIPFVMMCLCAFLIFLLAVGTVKWFAVDLALFFRGLMVMQRKINDGKLYDAYVIYSKDETNEKTETSLAHFINRVLPAILEDRCGFKLYICGRDDLPGEDCMELTEMRMQLSRRLIVVLTPGITGPQEAVTPNNYDWQVGLYQVLIQQEMSVILIQLGDMKDYSHLPLSLQHLLQKNPPLKWNEGSHNPGSPSSRFWKQVRYMMPVVPAQQCSSNSRSQKRDPDLRF